VERSKWLRRYLGEKEPTLENPAKVVRSFEECELNRGSGLALRGTQACRVLPLLRR
jgi:hypothetical protein